MKFSIPWVVSLAKEIRLFSAASRPVYGAIPALINYSIWAIGGVWSKALDISPVVPYPSRPFFIIGTTAFAYLFVFFWSKSLSRRSKSFLWPFEYFAIVLTAMLPTLVTLGSYLDVSALGFAEMCLRLILLVSVAESIVGFLVFRVNKRAKELAVHQVSLVDYEEKFLSTVYDHLHDTIQTRLFGIGVQLNQMRSNLAKSDSEKLSLIITEIESIRKADVRDFGTEFTPQISTFGLIPSLEKLFESNSKSISVRIQADLRAPLTAEEEDIYGLGIYRITEQALINSMIHGQAKNLDVRIFRRKEKLNLQISNDGEALKKGQLAQGHGFAVIDGWVSKLNGTWSISNQDKAVMLDLAFR